MEFATLIQDFVPASKAEMAAPAGTLLPPAETAPAEAPRARPEGAKSRRRKAAPAVKPSPAASVLPAPPAAPEPAPPVFTPGRPRSAEFPLDWPIDYDGRTWSVIVLRRPSAVEIGAYHEALAEGARIPLPVFFTPEGDPVPFAVIDQLDADDDDRIMERLADFLPDRLLRGFAAASAPSSTPPSGGTTAPTSST